MQVSIESIVAALPSMKQKDRAKVRMALDLMDRGAKSEEGETSSALLWGQIVSVARERGIALPPAARARKMSGWKAFHDDATAAVAFVATYAPRDETERFHLVRMAARALVARLEKLRSSMSLPITPTLVMRQAVNIPACLQEQWPGGSAEIRFLLRRELSVAS
jgi:hypothetical protein